MAASFLTQAPQPGDGAWLLQPNGDQRRCRNRTRRRKLHSFLNPPPEEVEEYEANIQPPAHAKARLTSFLYPSRQEQTSSAGGNEQPRTIGNETVLSTRGADERLPPASTHRQRQITTFLDDSANFERDYAYGSQPKPETPGEDSRQSEPEMASAVMPKGVPPHLRSRKTSAPSSNADAVHQGSQSPRTSPDAVREKLLDLGVKVSEPKPATPAPVNDTVGMNDQKSKVSDPKPATPTPVNHAVEMDDLKSKVSAHPVDAQSPRRDQGKLKDGKPTGRFPPSHQRGRGHGGRAAPREVRWPKKTDIPKTDPHRWDRPPISDHSGWDSFRADSGFGADKKKRAAAEEQVLTDWNGALAPAPIDWDGRPGFRDSETATQIKQWMEKTDLELDGLAISIPMEDVKLADGSILYFAPDPKKQDLLLQGHATPRYWIPHVIGNEMPNRFWDEHLEPGKPEPLDDGDLCDAKPWWRLYQRGHSFLQPVVHPAIAGIDPDESLDERLARENDNGSMQHAQNRARTEKAKQDAKRQRQLKAQERARKFSANPLMTTHERIKPTIHLYVRSARVDDIEQIRDIYNHYVDFAWCTPEMQRRTKDDVLQRYYMVLKNKLPFLVACERGGKVTSRKKRNAGEDLILPDRVVGFAFADDYNDMQGMYRFTAEVEVYAHASCYMKGVAKCLMDKLVGLLDPGYVERGGFDVQGEELDGVASSRLIQNIIVNLPYEKPERLERMSRWLGNWLGFEQAGNLKDIGNKNGKSVSLAIFQRKTAVSVDPLNPPIMMNYPK